MPGMMPQRKSVPMEAPDMTPKTTMVRLGGMIRPRAPEAATTAAEKALL